MSAWLFQHFGAPLQEGFFLKAMLGGVIVAVVCGVAGCLVVLRRMAFLGDALSHTMIAGVGAGYLFMKLVFGQEAHAPAMLLGSLLAGLITVGMISFVSRVSRIKEDSAIGIMYCGIFAAGAVLISVFSGYIHIDLVHFMLGDVLGVADADLWIATIAGAIVLSFVILFFRQLQLVSFDPVMAASIGLPVVLIDYLMTTCVSLVVVSAISMVGVILVVGLLITPAATAYLLTDRLRNMMWISACFGATSVVGGLYLCLWLNSAGGSAIMVFCTLQFLVVLALAPRYGLLAGWLRRRRMVPQELLEDVLRAILKAGQALPASALSAYTPHPMRKLERALGMMKGDGLLLEEGNGFILTEAGEKYALRLMRAHRLWEAYLQHVGAPEHELHERAHELEHLHVDATVNYLDHTLGHPLVDAHGAEIPEAPKVVSDPAPLLISQLREGQQARVVSIHGGDHAPALKMGEAITLKGRGRDGKTWLVLREQDQEIELEHDAADRVSVELLPTRAPTDPHRPARATKPRHPQ